MPKKKTVRRKAAKNAKKKKTARQPRAKARIRGRKAVAARTTRRQKKSRAAAAAAGAGGSSLFGRQRPDVETAGQAGDIQGLSRIPRADSESVEELEEEGQSREAEVVAGVEEAEDEESEVHTHEVPEDDVPPEYEDEQ